MRKNSVLFLKGFLIGVAKIIPGVSGAMLAITFGLYEKGIQSIRYFFNDVKGNLEFLVTVGLGVLLAVILSGKIVIYFLDTHYLITMLFFIGLIAGGIPSIMNTVDMKKRSNLFFLMISFGIIIMLSVLKGSGSELIFLHDLKSYFQLIGIGMIDALTMVVPGVSGTAIMMLIGCYETIIGTLGNLTNFSLFSSNLYILIPFLIGMILGIISFVFLMAYLFKKHPEKTYSMIIGLALSSLFLLFLETFQAKYQFIDILVGLVLLVIGYFISKKLES